MVTELTFWHDRVLLALADSRDGRLDSESAVIEEVAIRFADRFAPSDWFYEGERPRWHQAVKAALEDLHSARLVRQHAQPAAAEQWDPRASVAESKQPPPKQQVLTKAGRRRTKLVRDDVERAWARVRAEDRAYGWPAPDAPTMLLAPGVLAPPLRSSEGRMRLGFPPDEDLPMPVIAELDLHYSRGPDAALERLSRLWVRVTRDPAGAPTPLAEEYATGELSMHEMTRLVSADAAATARSARCLRQLWPDFVVVPQIDSSCVTIKADVARRAFNAYGDGIVWAVVDSGIWADHPHFAAYGTLTDESVRDLHRLFPSHGDPLPDPSLALVDELGHGTHVAGIIAGAIKPWLDAGEGRQVLATESQHNFGNSREPLRVPREVEHLSLLAGIAPKTKLVSLKVLHGGGSREQRVSRVMRALAYVRKVNGGTTASRRIHGVNLSVGYEVDPLWFTFGQSPLCREVDKLVRTGVVVVVAAGNSGHGSLADTDDASNRSGSGMTINDPGNAELAVTVGSTPRDAPHAYRVSYFSSKGPSSGGWAKPDLVAPGERITSCAAGVSLDSVVARDEVPTNTAVYVEETGTSMAASHVSGAIAALLSVHREFIGRPDAVKRMFVDTATPFGRRSDFDGAGLLDLMRVMTDASPPHPAEAAATAILQQGAVQAAARRPEQGERRTIRLFYSYSHRDSRFREELEGHLSQLRRGGLISEWSDRLISPGQEWRAAITRGLDTADMILLLISPDFMVSDYCYGVEVETAVSLHERGLARVIPIILRPVDWDNAPFGQLQALPSLGKPVTRWRNRDEAWLDVVRGLRTVVDELSPPTSPPGRPGRTDRTDN